MNSALRLLAASLLLLLLIAAACQRQAIARDQLDHGRAANAVAKSASNS